MPQPEQARCPVCGDGAFEFLRIADAPLHANLLWRSRQDAIAAPRAEMHLAGCDTCRYVFNTRFDPERMRYTERYDAALDFSPLFRSYADALAARLIERHGLRSKDIVEIGCGKGDFLKALCREGPNRGAGFDPSYDGPDDSGDVIFVRDFYSEAYAGYPADFICCRHVLEHIQDPARFVSMVRRIIGSRATAVYFEVPNGLYTFHDMGIWDLIYEHASYFTETSLATLFERCGFSALGTGVAYDNQFLWIEARAL